MSCPECQELKRLTGIDQAFIAELIETLAVCSKRLRCEAMTLHHSPCTRRPWKLRAGRLVCTPHFRAKKVNWA